MREEYWNSAVAKQLSPPIIEHSSYLERQNKPQAKSFPVGEKVLYLSSVIICVFLALIIISKHAKVAELSLGIRKMETQIHELNKLNLQLETQKEQLLSIENIRSFAESKGLELSLPKILPS